MRADENVDLAGGKRRQNFFARTSRVRGPSASAMRMPAARASGSSACMCWRASSSVGAISAPACPLRRHRAAPACDDGLARADIALQQPQHARGRRHVGFDFGQRLRLRLRERERQRCNGLLLQMRPSPFRLRPLTLRRRARISTSASWLASNSS
jgi:hypothetical protein